MVGVAKYDLNADFVELLRRQTLDGGLCANGHEHRGLDGAMRGVKAAAPGFAIGLQKFKSKCHAAIV